MMDSKTLMALMGSIQKWECIAQGIGAENGSQNCSLCHLYGRKPSYCESCPIYEHTGQTGCTNTPYAYTNLVTGGTLPEHANKNVNYEAIEAEIEFLISLLPDHMKCIYDLDLAVPF